MRPYPYGKRKGNDSVRKLVPPQRAAKQKKDAASAASPVKESVYPFQGSSALPP
jgi:hypothetical protein